MKKRLELSFGIIQIPIMVGLVLMAIAIPVTMKLSQKNQDNRNLAAEKKCSFGEEECQGGGTGYLCKCLEYCPGCGTYWRCTTYDPGRCLPPAPTPPPENYGCKGDKVNFTCVGKSPGDRCEGYPGTCLMTPGQEARGCICKPDDLSVLTPTVKPVTTPGTTVNSTSCFFGVSSCASINRYSKSGCCPAGAPASCCGDLIPNSAKVCQKETYECSGGKLRMCKSDGLGYTDWVTCASGSCQNGTSCTPVNSKPSTTVTPIPTQTEDKTLTACISGCDKDFAGKPDELKKCEDSCRNFVLAEPTKRLVPTATPIAHSLGECVGTNNNPFCVGLKDGDRCKGFAGTCRLFSGSIDKGCSCIEDTIPGVVTGVTPKVTAKPNGASCAGGTLDGQAACLNKNDCRVCKNGLYEKAANLEPCVGTGGVCDPYYGVQADQRNEINKFLGKTEEEIKREMCSGVASYLMASCMKAADTTKILANLPQTAKERAVEEKVQLQVMSLSSNGDKTALVNRCQQMEADKSKCANMSVEELVKNYLPIYQGKASEIAANYSKNNQQYKNETELANLLLSGNKDALVKKCRDENFDDNESKNKCGSLSIDQLVKEYLPFYKDQATALASEYSRIKDQAPIAQAVASGDKALLIKKCREATGGTGQCEKKSVSELIVLYLPAYQGQATQIAKQYEQVLTQQPVAEALVKGDKTKLIDLCKKQNPSRNCEKESLESLVKDYLPIYQANSSQLVNSYKQVEVANSYLTSSDDKFVNDGCAATQGAGTMAALKCIEYNKKPEDILKQTGMDDKTVIALVTQKKVSEVVMKYQYGQANEEEIINQCKLLKGKNCSDNQNALGSILALTNNPNLTVATVEEQKQKIAKENEAYRKVAGTLANLNTLESVTEQVSSGKMTWSEVQQNLDEQAKDPAKWLVMNWNNVTGGRFKRGNDMLNQGYQTGDVGKIVGGAVTQGGDAAAVVTAVVALPLAPVMGVGAAGVLGTGLGVAMVPQMSGMAVDTCELAKQGKATQADCNSSIALAGLSVAGAATGLLSQAANLTKVAVTAEALGTATKIGTATRAVGTVMNASKVASTALKVVEISSDVVGAVTFGDMAARTCEEFFKAQAEGRETEATGLDCASTAAMALASGGKLMGAVGGQIAKNSLSAEQALKAEQGIQKGMTTLHTVSADLFAASACSRVAGDLITNNGDNTNLDTVSMCAMGLSGAVQSHNLIKPIEVKPIASNNPVTPIDPANLITNGLKWNGAEKRWENASGQKVENLVPDNKYVYDQRVNNWREVSSGKFVSEITILNEQAAIMTSKSNLFWNMEKKVWVNESGKEVINIAENYTYENGRWIETKTKQVVSEDVVRSAQINRIREMNEVVIGREIGTVEARLEKAKQETLAAYEAEKGLPAEQRVKHAEALKKYQALEMELKRLQAVKAENGVNNQEAIERVAQAKEQEQIRQSDEVAKKQTEIDKLQEQIEAIVKENNIEKIDRRTNEGKKIAELEKQQAAIRQEIEEMVARGKQEVVPPVVEAKKSIFEQIKEKIAPKKENVELVAVDEVSRLTSEAKEKATKDAEVYEYDNRQKLIEKEKEILAKTESELAALAEGTELYIQKKAEVESSKTIIERLENLVEPANAAEIRQARVAVRFGEWGKEIPKAEERIALLEKKEAELTRAANSRSENRTWWERLTGKSEVEVRIEFYKRQNELFKVKKQLALERSLAVRESELMKATNQTQIDLLRGEIDRLMNLEEVKIKTGNETLDLTYEYLIREHEMKMQNDGMAGKNNVFSVDSSQTLAFLKAMSTPDILLEFALAGGKTTVIGPLIMKANNVLYGRTGEFIAAEGQSSQAYRDMVRAMSKDIKIPNNVSAEEVVVIDRITTNGLETVVNGLKNKKYVAIESGAARELERIINDRNSTAEEVRLAKEINKKISQGGTVIRDVVLVSSIGNDVVALRDRVKNATQIVTEASVPGFLETMILNGRGTPEQLKAAREVLTKLRKDVAVFVDEAHLNFDPNKVFVQGNGEGKPISESTKKNVEWLANELSNLGIIKKGEMIDLSVTDLNGRKLIEIKEEVSSFSKAGREVIAEKLAERLGISKEIIIEAFENGGRAKGSTEEVVRVLEIMNEYGRQLSMKKGSDFGLRENTESGKKQNAVIAKDGIAQLEMQHSNEVTAAVFETVVSMISGVEPNLGAINLTGKSAKAAFADHIAAIRADGNSSLAAGTGTIGRNRGTLESVYRLAVSESDLILEKFLGKRGDQGLIKENNILGVGRIEGTLDSFNSVLNRTVDQAVRIRDGANGNRGNLEVVLGGKDIAPDVWVKRAAESREFINGAEHEFIYRNENGVWKQVKVDASGKILSTTEVSYEYAKNVLNNPNTKNTTVIIGEGGATGTNVLAENTVPGIDIISTQTGRDQLDQSAARIGRIKGSKQETFMLVIGAEEGKIVTKTELRNIANEVQVKLNQQNTYQAVSAAIEIAGSKVLKEIILNGEEGSVGVRVAREALSELQNAEGGRNLEVNQTSESPIEALQRQANKVKEIYLEISKTGKYKELYEYLEKNNPELLAKVENNTKEIKLEFATETKTVAEGVLGSKDLIELAENFGKTITKDLLPEKISRSGKNAEEVIAEILEQVKKEQVEVGMAEGQAERQPVVEEKISPSAKYAFENRAQRLGIETFNPAKETWSQFVNRVNVAGEQRQAKPIEKKEEVVVVGNAAKAISQKVVEYQQQIKLLGGNYEKDESLNQLKEKTDELVAVLERKAAIKRNANETVEEFKNRVERTLTQREADKKALIEEVRSIFKKYGIDLSPDGKPVAEVRELDLIAAELGDNLPKFEKGEKWPTYFSRVKQKQADLVILNQEKEKARKEFRQITLEENSEIENISKIEQLEEWKQKVRARVASETKKVEEVIQPKTETVDSRQMTIEEVAKARQAITNKAGRLIVYFEKQVEGLTAEEKNALEQAETEEDLQRIESQRINRITENREKLNQEAISLGTKRLNGESDEKLRARLDGIKVEYQQFGRQEGESYFAFKSRVKKEREQAAIEAKKKLAEAEAKAQAEAKAKEEARVKAEADAKAKAKAEAEAKAQAEAKAKEEARVKAEADAKAQTEAKAKEEARVKAEAEAKAQAEAKAKEEAEAEAKRKELEEEKKTALELLEKNKYQPNQIELVELETITNPLAVRAWSKKVMSRVMGEIAEKQKKETEEVEKLGKDNRIARLGNQTNEEYRKRIEAILKYFRENPDLTEAEKNKLRDIGNEATIKAFDQVRKENLAKKAERDKIANELLEKYRGQLTEKDIENINLATTVEGVNIVKKFIEQRIANDTKAKAEAEAVSRAVYQVKIKFNGNLTNQEINDLNNAKTLGEVQKIETRIEQRIAAEKKKADEELARSKKEAEEKARVEAEKSPEEKLRKELNLLNKKVNDLRQKREEIKNKLWRVADIYNEFLDRMEDFAKRVDGLESGNGSYEVMRQMALIVLGVSQDDPNEIRSAYRKFALDLHPDLSGDGAMEMSKGLMIIFNEAQDFLVKDKKKIISKYGINSSNFISTDSLSTIVNALGLIKNGSYRLPGISYEALYSIDKEIVVINKRIDEINYKLNAVNAEAEAKAKEEARVKAEAESKAKEEAKAKAEAEAKAQAEAKAKEEAKAKAEAEAKAKAKEEAEAEAKRKELEEEKKTAFELLEKDNYQPNESELAELETITNPLAVRAWSKKVMSRVMGEIAEEQRMAAEKRKADEELARSKKEAEAKARAEAEKSPEEKLRKELETLNKKNDDLRKQREDTEKKINQVEEVSNQILARMENFVRKSNILSFDYASYQLMRQAALAVLGVSEDNPEKIRFAYLKLVNIFHPDRNGDGTKKRSEVIIRFITEVGTFLDKKESEVRKNNAIKGSVDIYTSPLSTIFDAFNLIKRGSYSLPIISYVSLDSIDIEIHKNQLRIDEINAELNPVDTEKKLANLRYVRQLIETMKSDLDRVGFGDLNNKFNFYSSFSDWGDGFVGRLVRLKNIDATLQSTLEYLNSIKDKVNQYPEGRQYAELLNNKIKELFNLKIEVSNLYSRLQSSLINEFSLIKDSSIAIRNKLNNSGVISQGGTYVYLQEKERQLSTIISAIKSGDFSSLAQIKKSDFSELSQRLIGSKTSYYMETVTINETINRLSDLVTNMESLYRLKQISQSNLDLNFREKIIENIDQKIGELENTSKEKEALISLIGSWLTEAEKTEIEKATGGEINKVTERIKNRLLALASEKYKVDLNNRTQLSTLIERLNEAKMKEMAENIKKEALESTKKKIRGFYQKLNQEELAALEKATETKEIEEIIKSHNSRLLLERLADYDKRIKENRLVFLTPEEVAGIAAEMKKEYVDSKNENLIFRIIFEYAKVGIRFGMKSDEIKWQTIDEAEAGLNQYFEIKRLEIEKQERIKNKKASMTNFINEVGERTARVGGIIREFGFENAANWGSILGVAIEVEKIDDTKLAQVRKGETTIDDLIKQFSVKGVEQEKLKKYLVDVLQKKYKNYEDFLSYLDKVQKIDKKLLPVVMKLRIILGDNYQEVADQLIDIYQKAEFENIDTNDLEESIKNWLSKKVANIPQKQEIVDYANRTFVKRFEEIESQPITRDRLIQTEDGGFRDRINNKKYLRMEDGERVVVASRIMEKMGLLTVKGYLLEDGYYYEEEAGLSDYQSFVWADYLVVAALMGLTEDDFIFQTNKQGQVLMVVKTTSVALEEISLDSVPEINNLRKKVANFKNITDAQIIESLKKLTALLTAENIEKVDEKGLMSNILITRKEALQKIGISNKSMRNAEELIRQLTKQEDKKELEPRGLDEDEIDYLKRKKMWLEENLDEITQKLNRKKEIEEIYRNARTAIIDFKMDELILSLNTIYGQIITESYQEKAIALESLTQLDKEKGKIEELIEILKIQASKLEEYSEAEEIEEEIRNIISKLEDGIKTSKKYRNQISENINNETTNLEGQIGQIISIMTTWRDRIYNNEIFNVEGSIHRTMYDHEKEPLFEILNFWESQTEEIRSFNNLEKVSKDKLESILEKIINQKSSIEEKMVFFKGGVGYELINYLSSVEQIIERYSEGINTNSKELAIVVDEMSRIQNLADDYSEQISFISHNIDYLEDELRMINQQIEEIDTDLLGDMVGKAKEAKGKPFNRKGLVVGNRQVVNQVIHFYDKRAKTGKVVASLRIDEELMNQSLEAARKNGAREGEINFISAAVYDNQTKKLTEALVYEEDGVTIKLSLAKDGETQIRAAIGLINIEIDQDKLVNMSSEDLLRLVVGILKEKFGIDNLFEDIDTASELEAKRKILGVQNRKEYKANDPELASYRLNRAYEDYNTFVNSDRAKEEAKKYGRFAFYHKVANPSDLASILEHGLMSSMERFERGLFVSGQSTQMDFETGGANSVFTRMMAEKALDLDDINLAGINIIFDSQSLYGRADWYASDHDSYGSTENFEKRQTPQEAIVGQITGGYNSANEQMFNAGIAVRAIKKIVVRNQMQYEEVVGILKASGLDRYLGLVEKIEDISVDQLMNISWGNN